MPQIDPKTGKQLSGAAKRKATKKRTTTYKTAVAAVAASGPGAAQQIPGSADFAGLAPAPIGNPAEAVAWVNDLMLVALQQVIRDPSLDGNNLERWRQIKEFGKALGMVQAKAAEQNRLKKLSESMGQATAAGSTPRGAKGLAGIAKPPTARRA